MTEFTKGPWIYRGTLDLNEQPMVEAESSELIAVGCHECVKQIEELRENGHRIAAAPDMYEDLKGVLTAFEDAYILANHNHHDATLRLVGGIEAAIAKAEGKA